MKAEQHSGTKTYNDEESESEGPFQRWVQSTIKNPAKAYKAMFATAAIFFLLTTLFPLYWLVMLALSGENPQDVFLTPDGFNPSVFIRVFTEVPFHRYMFNSIVLALATTIIVLLVASLAGYALGRLQFRGKQFLMLTILVISFFPPAAFFVPLFELFTQNIAPFGITPPRLYNTPGAMLIPFSAIFMPLSIFILSTFFKQIPDGLEDAARIEGTTRLGALFRVIIPLSAPGVATAGILTFIAVYNEYFFSFLMTDGGPQQWAPIVEGLKAYQQQYEIRYDLMAAASVVGVLPIAALVVLAQEKIVSGLTSGALKE